MTLYFSTIRWRIYLNIKKRRDFTRLGLFDKGNLWYDWKLKIYVYDISFLKRFAYDI